MGSAATANKMQAHSCLRNGLLSLRSMRSTLSRSNAYTACSCEDLSITNTGRTNTVHRFTDPASVNATKSSRRLVSPDQIRSGQRQAKTCGRVEVCGSSNSRILSVYGTSTSTSSIPVHTAIDALRWVPLLDAKASEKRNVQTHYNLLLSIQAMSMSEMHN